MEEPRVGSSSGYDVFINFRGEDTRNTFVGHLFRALKYRAINAFIDSDDLRKEEAIENLLDVIRGCELSIAVFSQRYAESKWCLKELSQMLECHRTDGHIILPIFFKVDTSEVKNQTGCFEISHANEAPETLLRWKDALRAAGDKSGWVFQDGIDQAQLVYQVVAYVWNRLKPAVFINFRGVDTRNTFVGHLYRALRGRGIRPFIDRNDLPIGEDIGFYLLNAIRGCELSIAVFSRRYAKSKWCLKELSQMVACHRTNGHIILPIFFKVKPSDVKNQTGCFQISHANEAPETLLTWKDALRAAGYKCGWVNDNGDDELELIDQVVAYVWNRVNFMVFINFRGPDTRGTIVDNLYHALKRSNIRVFIDSEDLRKGEDIEHLLRVIRGCKISIAVFSQRYTESNWCLKELSQMVECHKNNDHIVLSIFFKVKPSDVKNQTGCFQILPLTHTKEAPETLLRWKDALRTAGNKIGWVHDDGDDQSEIVDQVVQYISARLNNAY